MGLQLVKHCSTNAEAMGSNLVEALKIFFGLKVAITYCDDHISIPNLILKVEIRPQNHTH